MSGVCACTCGVLGVRRVLSDAERDDLIRALLKPDDDCAHNMVPLYTVVERIVTDRLRDTGALQEALLDKWRSLPVWGPDERGLMILDGVDLEGLLADVRAEGMTCTPAHQPNGCCDYRRHVPLEDGDQ